MGHLDEENGTIGSSGVADGEADDEDEDAAEALPRVNMCLDKIVPYLMIVVIMVIAGTRPKRTSLAACALFERASWRRNSVALSCDTMRSSPGSTTE